MALLRYQGQGAELAIEWPGGPEPAQAAFAKAHRALNGFTLDSKVELVTLRVEAEAMPPSVTRNSLARGHGAARTGAQIVQHATGALEASVFDRARLGAGDRIAGPAIMTQLDATTLVSPGWNAEALHDASLLLRRDT